MEERSPSRGLGPLAGADDGCLVFDFEGRIVAANDSAARALGFAPDELTGRRAWEVCSCLTENGFEWTVEALRSEGPQSLLGHLRRRDGSLLATDTHLWLASFDGEPRVFALARDLRGQQGLVEERERLANLVEASSELVAQFDDSGRLAYINAAGLALLGIERLEDAHGLTPAELFVLDQRALIEEKVLPRAQRERWEGALFLRSWKDDRRTPCWAQVFAVLHSRSRKLQGVALIARDETERVAAETRRARLLRLTEVSRQVATSLLGSEDLNEAIFQILSGVTVTLGATRSFLNRFREDRRWVLRTHEWSAEEGACHRVAGPAEPEESHRWATAVLERRSALRIDDTAELAPPHGRGLIEPGERALLALPVYIRGELTGVFGFACAARREWEDDEVAGVQIIVDSFARGVERQIAEREKLQARRELELAVEREKVANRYKSEFLASMSHELRTPMNAIRGYAELLSRPSPERSLQEQWIQNLQRSTEYLLGLVHDVLDLSKIEAGAMVIERSTASLAEILTSVHDLLAAGAREKCLEFRVEVEGEVPAELCTDPVRLKQILVNLTANALKFTGEGSVVVRASRGAGATLDVAVRDTGIGIPAEALDRLFQPFSQLHTGTGGTGLGLQISRRLARLLGGDIRVESEVGRGSTFVLALPLEGASGTLRQLPLRAPATRPAARPLPAALHAKRLLVVDDSHENREVLRFLLQEAGASCETAVDGRAGIERALSAQRAGTPYDAILMDMNMPVMDGFEATRRLVRSGVASPVIALTALALAGDEARCREAGCVAYVAKPIVPSTFFDVLALHLGEKGEPRAPTAAAEQADGHVLSLAQHPRFRGLVDRYLASFPELVKRLRALERSGDVGEMRTLVHRLRGTAASYGFPGVSQAAGRCEDAIRAGEGREEIARKLEELLGRLDVAMAG